MFDNHIARARLLMESSRYQEAQEELRRALSIAPDNETAHALSAINLSMTKDHISAVHHGENAVASAPELPFTHYALAIALYNADRKPEAEKVIRGAIRLDPFDADLRALLAQIHLWNKDWDLALKEAEEGLQADAEHVECLNVRAIALRQLNRKEESGAVIEHTLRVAPDNTSALVNLGWNRIEQGKHREALEHFREALRLEPENEAARFGVLEALKSGNPVYRVILRYFLWMSKISDKASWGVIIAAVILQRILKGIAQSSPSLAPFAWTLLGLLLLFIFLTWTATPLFNLALRLHPLGRYALSHDERVASNWTGGTILLALLALGGALLTEIDYLWGLAIGSGLMIIPIAGTFNAPSGRPRRILTIYTSGLAVLGVIALLLFANDAQGAGVTAGAFFLGTFFFGWIANYLIMQRR